MAQQGVTAALKNVTFKKIVGGVLEWVKIQFQAVPFSDAVCSVVVGLLEFADDRQRQLQLHRAALLSTRRPGGFAAAGRAGRTRHG